MASETINPVIRRRVTRDDPIGHRVCVALVGVADLANAAFERDPMPLLNDMRSLVRGGSRSGAGETR